MTGLSSTAGRRACSPVSQFRTPGGVLSLQAAEVERELVITFESTADRFPQWGQTFLALESLTKTRSLTWSVPKKLLEECFPVFGIEGVLQFLQR
jgi:hypothetical protein